MENRINPFDAITGPQLLAKTASVAGAEQFTTSFDEVIATTLKEEGFMRKVIDFKPVAASEMMPDLYNGQSYCIVPIEGEMGTFIDSNFKDVPTVVEHSEGYAKIVFGKIQLPVNQFSEVNLMFHNNRPLKSYKKNLMYNIGEIGRAHV